MIRDPSDGSVKEPPKPVVETGTSGLQTGSEKPEHIARLEWSRDWLRDYRKKQSNTEVAEAPIGHPSSEDVETMNGDC